ncbi:MAG: PEGA domain-containing protein [Myxococcales bacterium]|nr:PEGA domain-containing protein [Myxococcales bacterium]MBP6845187.1 PEGA domain-containing protein [Kofleriaceae bacterium]
MKLALTLALLTFCAGTAAAGGRSTAVLEFRSGTKALPAISGRVGGVLSGRTSLKVLGGDQARQRYGEGLDQAVVECAGDAVCIGAIGARLGTDEVLLVGVSELGDVIFTLQRIKSGDGTVDGRVAEALAADTVPSDDDLVGYLERVLPAEDFVRFGTLAIKVNVAGAEIWVGGTSKGRSPIDAIRVPAPSRYPIEIKKAGFAPFRASVQISPDTEVNVDAELTRPGGKASAWYSKWWVVATAGVVVAGAVTTAVILTRESDTVPVMGHF